MKCDEYVVIDGRFGDPAKDKKDSFHVMLFDMIHHYGFTQ